MQIAELKGIVKEKFFLEIGLKYDNFKGKAKNTALNSASIAKLFTNYPDINLEWLLTGEGSMLKNTEEKGEKMEELEKENQRQAAEIARLKDELLNAYRKIDKLAAIFPNNKSIRHARLATELIEK